MNRDIVRQIAVIIALLITLTVNFLANALPLNGQTSAEVANRLPIYFVPANYVFGIWGVIYTLLILYAVYQALPAQRENPRLRKIGSLFVLSCIANSAWLVLFHYEYFPLTMVAMVILLLTLITIYRRLDIGRMEVSGGQKWLVNLPFSVYLGWITVATIANASYVLYDAHWNGFGLSGAVWAVILLVVAAVVTLGVIIRHHDIAYTTVIVWALIGIVIKQNDTPMVAITAAAMMAAVTGAALIFRFVQRPGRAY